MSADPIDAARALRFLRALAKHNDRAWFAEHRATYDEHVRPEWEDLVAGLLARAVSFDERFAYTDPRTCIFRLARDIRFSNDKTPFKTRVSAWLSPLGKSGANAGYYIALEPGRSVFAAGIYTPTREALLALREHFAGDSRPFARILRARVMAPYLPLDTDALQRTPRGHPKVQTQPELIRHGAFATFAKMMRDCAAFVAYIDRIAGGV